MGSLFMRPLIQCNVNRANVHTHTASCKEKGRDTLTLTHTHRRIGGECNRMHFTLCSHVFSYLHRVYFIFCRLVFSLAAIDELFKVSEHAVSSKNLGRNELAWCVLCLSMSREPVDLCPQANHRITGVMLFSCLLSLSIFSTAAPKERTFTLWPRSSLRRV